MFNKSSKRRGAAAVEYALVLTILSGLSVPLVTSITGGVDESLDQSAVDIGRSSIIDIERSLYQPRGGDGFTHQDLLAGDDLTETGYLDDNTSFQGGFESGPHTIPAGETLTFSGGPNGTTLTGPLTVCTTFLSFSPETGSASVQAQIDFPTDVLGWVTDYQGLLDTDEAYGIAFATYSDDPARGFESANDSVTYDPDTNSISLDVTATAIHSDQIRVFIDCSVPVPDGWN